MTDELTADRSTGLRDRLALALDVGDLEAAQVLVRRAGLCFGVVKIGFELFIAGGPAVVAAFTAEDRKVFLDLKLHDIPTTVGRAARVLGALGATYVTLHAQGGVAMLRAGVDGLMTGADQAGLAPPSAIAVTVLTSDDGAPPHILGKRVANALDGGCAGIVCSASDVREAKLLAPRLFAVVPGIRLSGNDTHDHARSSTPDEAVIAGADLLVVGRAVTAAPDRLAAAAAVADAVLAAS